MDANGWKYCMWACALFTVGAIRSDSPWSLFFVIFFLLGGYFCFTSEKAMRKAEVSK